MFRKIGAQTDVLGESPVWSVDEQALYWVDIRGRLVRRYRTATETVDTWALPELVGSLALRSDGNLILALKSGVAFFEPRSGGLEMIATPEMQFDQRRLNDGKCDRQGRFWVGSMNDVTRAPEGTLYRVSGKASCTGERSGVRIPNGLAFNPEGTRMYFADSDIRTIFSYSYDPVTGTPKEESVFARMAPPAIPDGATVDASGCLWVAEYDGGRITRYRPDGMIDRVLPVPLRKPTSCAFGGPNLDTLFITTASQGLDAEELLQQPLAGALLAVDVGVSGVPEPVFRD